MFTLKTCATTCFVGIRHDFDALAPRAFAFQEGRRIALHRIRHQAREHIQQLLHAGAGLGGDEAHRHQMAFAQRLLERIVQLLRRELLALLEVQRHQLLVDFDDLVDDLGMRSRDRGEVRLRAARREKTVDHRSFRPGGQIERQAFTPEGLAQLGQHPLRSRIAAVDLVDDDQPAQPAIARELHHPLRHGLDAVDGADDDRRVSDGLQHGERAAGEVGVARRVDQIDAPTLVLEVHERRIERVAQLLLLRIEIAHRRAALETAARPDGAGFSEQALGQQRLARAGLTYERDVADVRVEYAIGSRPPFEGCRAIGNGRRQPGPARIRSRSAVPRIADSD